MNTEIPQDPGPLSPAHYKVLAAAEDRSKKIRRAANIARFNGYCTAFFAIVSALFTVFSTVLDSLSNSFFNSISVLGLIVTLGLTVVAYNEFRGRKRLLNFEPAAATYLGWNQIGFLALIIGYCVWRLYEGLTTPIAEQVQSMPEFQSLSQEFGFQNLGTSLEDIVRLSFILVYGLVILLSLCYQGWNALYYFGQKKNVEEYLSETPGWVLDLKRLTQ